MDQQIEELKRRIKTVEESLDVPALKSRHGELLTKSMEENFWKNQQGAKAVMQEIAIIEDKLKTLDELSKQAIDLEEYWNLMKQEGQREATDEVQKEYEAIDDRLKKFELLLFLSGKYDTSNALLSIHAGQGGTEANDWAEMLLRMYLRYAEKQGWKTEVLHQVKGEEAGISTVTIEITGPYAFGYLKNEKGTHRLVRLSPYNAQNLRQTSFAGVEVVPVIESTDEKAIEIKPEDIEFKAVRASGPGGQNVNKTSTAVTIKHISTGIVVHASNQRSQLQNKENALRMLRAKLFELEQQKEQEEMSKIKGEHKVAAWGNQIRNYVLQPYKLVKDLRTGIESTDPESVLDGEIDKFIEAEIRL